MKIINLFKHCFPVKMAKVKKSRKKKTKKRGRCWKGYKPTPGKTPYSKGSCRKA